MTQEQLASIKVDDANMARALRQDTDFLSLFAQPKSPTQVAKATGMAANLAHHHAKKLADLGLLFEQRREGRKVFYQLAALEFRVPSLLLPPDEEAGNGSGIIRKLSEGFMQAYERSWARMHADEEDVMRFGAGEQRPELDVPPHDVSDEAYPTHLDHLTLRLSPERYRALAHALSQLLTEAAAEDHSKEGQHCTLAVLAFEDGRTFTGDRLSRSMDSFLGGEK